MSVEWIGIALLWLVVGATLVATHQDDFDEIVHRGRRISWRFFVLFGWPLIIAYFIWLALKDMAVGMFK